jgi:cell division protein FtsW (lipid II flippase)
VNVAVIVIDPPHASSPEQRTGLRKLIHVLKPHQEKRIASMIWPDKYKHREGFQRDKAIMLVGAGQLHGLGAQRAQKFVYFNALPEDHNDMIFPVIVARWGLLGGAVTLALYCMLVISILAVGARSKDPFARLACVGFAGFLFCQMTINVGMTMGIMPVTGITLPLVSYGGSSLVVTFAMIGLVINFATARQAIIARPSFEFDRPRAAAD